MVLGQISASQTLGSPSDHGPQLPVPDTPAVFRVPHISLESLFQQITLESALPIGYRGENRTRPSSWFTMSAPFGQCVASLLLCPSVVKSTPQMPCCKQHHPWRGPQFKNKTVHLIRSVLPSPPSVPQTPCPAPHGPSGCRSQAGSCTVSSVSEWTRRTTRATEDPSGQGPSASHLPGLGQEVFLFFSSLPRFPPCSFHLLFH